MNKIILIGNLTKKPEIEKTNSGTEYSRVTIACRRKVANEQGQHETDFISCIAWKSVATFMSKYFDKGDKIGIVGTLQTRNYEDAGVKKYISEVIIGEVEFVSSQRTKEEPKDDGLKEIDKPDDERLPF